MKLSEAYKVLELPQGVSQDEVKKRARDLMKLYHPDVNKRPGAEEKFKKINEAFERIKSGEPDVIERSRTTSSSSPFYDVGSIFESMFGGQMGGQRHRGVGHAENVHLKLSLTFEESVVGAYKTVKYYVNDFCQACEGMGTTIENNGCKTCGGRGIKETVHSSGVIFTSMKIVCPTCQGNVKMNGCLKCLGAKTVKRERVQQIHTPPGVKNGTVLRVRGAGHAIVSPTPSGHTDVILEMLVAPSQHGLTLVDNNVIYTAQINLVDALRGKKLNVPTVHGTLEIDVPPRSKNADKVLIPGRGVAPSGNQVVILDVTYPDDVSKIIDVL